MALEKLAKTPALLRKIGQVGDTRPFYSPIDKAISEITQNKATGEQMLAALLKTKGVAKELKDRPAIKKALEQPKITKQELERVAAEHPPAQIEESRSSGTFNQLEPTLPNDGSLELVEDPPSFSGNRYPYGVRDTKTGDIIGYGWDKGDAILDVYSGYPQYWGKHAQYEQYTIPGGENYREILLKLPKGEGEVFKASHFEGEPNILAHARVADRTGPNGEKILHVEEIQSDWHQKARDARNKEVKRLMQSEGIDKATASKRVPESFGYKENAEQKYVEYLEDLQKRVAENIKQTMIGEGVPEERAIILGQKMAEKMADDPRKLAGFLDEDDQLMVLLQARLKDREAVPDAPFKQNWHELVIKRLLDDAARNGYDKVVITPGAEQAKRYALSNVIDEINVVGRTHALTGEQTKQVALDTIDGRSLRLGVANDGTIDNVSDITIEGFLGKKLDEVVGKDVAKNIMEGGSQTISGEGLQVGGEGMKGFYDQILPSYLNNYGKPYGSRVGEYTMPEVATPLHSFDITPQMREDIIGKGLPLYQVAPVGIGAGAAMQGEQPEGYGAGGVVKKAVKAVLPKGQQAILPAAESAANLERFLADSAIKDRLYHGTNNDFRKFSDKKLGQNTDPNATSESYAQTARVGHWFNTQPTGKGPEKFGAGYTVDMPVYLSIKNPKREMNLDWLAQGLESKKGRAYRRELEEQGYDGVVLPDEEFGGESWIAFQPTQIKSAIGNRGTYDITDPDITKAKGGSVSKDAMFMAVMNKNLKGKKNA